jgi:hypothetical protein
LFRRRGNPQEIAEYLLGEITQLEIPNLRLPPQQLERLRILYL